MSTSLLKRTIALLETTDGNIGESDKGKKEKPATKRHKRSHKHNTKSKPRKSAWHSADDIRQRIQVVDRSESNLRALKLLASGSVDLDTATKILSRSGLQKVEKPVQPKEDKTVFTEEDFQTFEQEYFVTAK